MILLKQIKGKIKKHGFKKGVSRFLLRQLSRIIHTNFNLKYILVKYLKGQTIKRVNGFKMWLDLKNDQGIARDLFIYGKREHLSTKFILESNIIKPGDTVLDIGANIGYYALIESKLVGKEGRVYALEPVQRNFNTLNKNISLNKINNIKTFNLAAGNKNEESYIHVGTKGNWSSLVFDAEKDFVSKEKIQVKTVDQFLQDKKIPSFVRMDVEGYEHAIIEGMQNTLNKDVSLLIEIHPTILTPEETKKMFSILKEKNFTNATVIFDPPLKTLTKKGKRRFLSKFILNKLQAEEDRNPNKPQNISLDELEHLTKIKNRHIHTLIKKN